MNFLHPRWNTVSMDNLLRKSTSFMWRVFSPTGNLYVEIIYGYRETPHKKNDYMVSSCNLCSFSFNKKMRIQANLLFFFIAAQKGTLNCSCLTSWLPLVCFWKKRKLNLLLVFSVMELIRMWKVWQGCLSPVKNAEVSVDKNIPHKRVLKWKQREEDVK